MLPAPTVAAAGTLAFQRLSSPRPSAVPCPSDPTRLGGTPPVRFAVRSLLHAEASLSAQPSVLRRPQFLTTWAWQSLVPVPQSARCRAFCRCERVSLRFSSGRRSLRSGLAASPSDVLPRGRQGPFRASWRAAPRSAFAGSCPRSCDHRPCRIRFTSGRHSGIRNRPFRFALHPFRKRASAHQNWFQYILCCPVRLVNFCLSISALRRFFQASFPSRQDRCCASSVSRTSTKMRSYPQAAEWLVDNFASCGIGFVLVL